MNLTISSFQFFSDSITNGGGGKGLSGGGCSVCVYRIELDLFNDDMSFRTY